MIGIVSSTSNLAPLSRASMFVPKRGVVDTVSKLVNNHPFFQGCLLGTVVGLQAAHFIKTSGISDALHECIGHIWLGCYLTTDYSAEGSQLPTFFLRGHHYKNEPDSPEGFVVFGSGKPNYIGKLIGENGKQAWISLAGSIPGLILETAILTAGIALLHFLPVIGSSLIVCGFTHHIVSSNYPIEAARMSYEQILEAQKNGHDFADFAIRIGIMTSLPPRAIAVTTAIVFFISVPLAALSISSRLL